MPENTISAGSLVVGACGVLVSLLVSLAMWILSGIKRDQSVIFHKLNRHGERIEAMEARCEERHARRKR
jgi:hypothetical protein